MTSTEVFLLFLEKEAKSTGDWAAKPSAKPTLGVWGLAPKERIGLIVFFF
jgi:hypothetical protein